MNGCVKNGDKKMKKSCLRKKYLFDFSRKKTKNTFSSLDLIDLFNLNMFLSEVFLKYEKIGLKMGRVMFPYG